VYEFQTVRDSSVVGSCIIVYDWNDRFTGKPYSAATGLYYDFQRWYDPSIGRFISADRVAGYRRDPQSLNPYAYVENSPTNNIDPSGLDCLSSVFDFGSCAGNFLYDNTVGAAVNSYDWYQSASDSDRMAFWTGVGVAVGIGIVVGASCVVAGCAGLALLAIGAVTTIGGSFAAGATYTAVGGQSEGGLRATMFWGGIGAGVGFAVGGFGASLLASRATSSAASSSLDDFVSATSRFSAKFQGEDVSFPESAARTIWNKGHYDQISEALGLKSPGEVVDSIARTVNTGYRVLNPKNQFLYAIESDTVPLRVIVDPMYWEVVNAFPL
jgi:RHS repeat-associated protein